MSHSWLTQHKIITTSCSLFFVCLFVFWVQRNFFSFLLPHSQLSKQSHSCFQQLSSRDLLANQNQLYQLGMYTHMFKLTCRTIYGGIKKKATNRDNNAEQWWRVHRELTPNSSASLRCKALHFSICQLIVLVIWPAVLLSISPLSPTLF